MIILYGTEQNKIDITKKCFELFKKENYLIIPSNDSIRTSYFGDPDIGKQKKIYIDNIEYSESEKIKYSLSDEYKIEIKNDEEIIDITDKVKELNKKKDVISVTKKDNKKQNLFGTVGNIIVNGLEYPIKSNINYNLNRDKHISILIRTSYRPNKFKKCIDSIIEQEYKNYTIIVSYDNIDALEYIPEDMIKIKVEKEDKEYNYNLYCNELKKKIKNGWILFLDDDDKLSDKNSLNKIVEEIKSRNDLIFWKFKLHDRIIHSNTDIKGKVANSGYIFHSDFAHLSKFKAEDLGDYKFIKNLSCQHNFNKKFIDEILVESQKKNDIILKNNVSIIDNLKEISLIFNNTIYILYSKYFIYHKNFIYKLFSNYNINCVEVNYKDYNYKNYKDKLLFLISPVSELNNKFINYIIYNLEQYNYNWFNNNNYINLLKNSIINFDYSLVNIRILYQNYKIILHYLPLKLYINNKIDYEENNYNYDILFIGGLNERRNNIIKKLHNNFSIMSIGNKNFKEYGSYEYEKILKKCKIVLNIHYNDNCKIIETSRLNECLSYKKIIVSEITSSLDSLMYSYYNNVFYIDIINDNNINSLISLLKYLTINYSYYIKKKLSSNNLNNLKCRLNDIINHELNKKIIFNQNNNYNFKIGIVTCNIKNYDNYENNITLLKNYKDFDWFYISDKSINEFKFINILDYNEIFNKLDIKNYPDLQSKYFKMNIFNIKELIDYEYIIWMDASIIINNSDFILNMYNLISNNINDIYLFNHYKNLNVKEEYIMSNSLEKYNRHNKNLYNLTKKYNELNLYETGFMILKNCKKIKNMLDDWWNEIITHKNTQCQIILPYVLKKNNIYDIYCLNENDSKFNNLKKNIWKNSNFYVKLNHNQPYILNSLNNKINKINYILFINLNRSIDRYKNILHQLENINIKKIRIEAIDGKNENVNNIIKLIKTERNLNNYEIACTLSHIKAINYINNLIGDYFLIVEDDVNFHSCLKFNEDLEKIINDCPDFDILMLNKTTLNILSDKYTRLNSLDEKPGSAVAYIITKDYATEFNKKNFITDNLLNTKNNLDVSDIFLYKNCNTYIYQFNYFNSFTNNSTIHNNHLKFHKLSNFFDEMNFKYLY